MCSLVRDSAREMLANTQGESVLRWLDFIGLLEDYLGGPFCDGYYVPTENGLLIGFELKKGDQRACYELFYVYSNKSVYYRLSNTYDDCDSLCEGFSDAFLALCSFRLQY